MASPTQPDKFRQTPGDMEDRGAPSVPQCMGSPSVGHDLVTEQQPLWVHIYL